MRLNLLVMTALLLALPVPTSAGEAPVTGNIQANGLEIRGDVSLNSTVAVALGEWPILDPILPDPAFELTGLHARVKTFYSDPKANADAIGLALEGSVHEESYDDFIVVGDAVRPNYKWAAFPMDGVVASLTTQCVSLAPSDAQVVERKSNVGKGDEPDNVMAADVAETIRVTTCDNATTIQITGDFLLTLWEWDATLESNGQAVELPSGRRQSQHDLVGSSATRTVISDARQQYLYVTGGRLQLPANALTDAYVHAAGADAQGSFEFRDVEGEVHVNAADHDIEAQTLRLLGDLDITVIARDGILDGAVGGRINSADADGQLLAWTTTSTVAPTDSTWMWGLLAGSALAAAMAWRLSRSARLEWHTRRAMAAMDEQRFRVAQWHCTAMLRIRRTHAEARIIRALALTGLDRIEAALKDHEAAHGILAMEGGGELGAQNAVEAALTTLERGDKTQARRWLEAASRCDAGAVYALLTADHREALRPLMVNLRAANDAYA